MTDIKQSLRDFVATANSGKYSNEDDIFSKFPEFKEYDRQLLRDFLSTANSGKYSTEDEVFSKFPEFNIDVKKKESSQVGSQKTQPTSGSKPAQSSGKSFAGSIDYLEPKPKFGEIPTAPKVPGTERVVPAQSKSSSSPKVSQNGNTWQLPGTVSKGVGLNQLDEEDKALNVLSKKPTLKFVEDEDLKAEIRKNPKAWTEKVIEKNPSLKDQTIDGVLPGLMDEDPTIESESKQNLEKAKKLVDYTESYDQDFDNMVKIVKNLKFY